ncbi:twin-arginine translocase TatA/TatE family subunit [Methylosinus sporium]|uniref:Sec-independent protein translocase protein TatA n=1 Tax=Methylosinus sporium TaxID=428 RepID=A0A2U1SMY6_METSR|nr:twin-arginine translocase TatA/TatE family subunit [Methylosinus sporium]PWB92974.1 twin-arginine translocase TatA/TatE family subunit [Methylosinus sporium]
MGGLSIWHWIIVGGVAFILFGGRFKISDVMGDVAKGIKAFKKGLAEDETEAKTEEPTKSLEHSPLTSPSTLHADKPAEAKKA